MGRFLGLDPLGAKFPSWSDYNYVMGNPISLIDPDGRFVLQFDTATLEEAGMSQEDIGRLQSILDNISAIVNQNAMSVLQNTTGFSQDRIMADLQNGAGPIILMAATNMGIKGEASGITIDPTIVKSLAEVSFQDTETLSEQVLAVALKILHEYGHVGDQITNSGFNSGEWLARDNKIQFTVNDPTISDPAVRLGTQNWPISYTGERGQDVEVFGYGVVFDLENDKSWSQSPIPTAPPAFKNLDLPQIPNSLPNN